MDTNEVSQYNDGVLSRVFSSPASAKILDFFLDHSDFDYSIPEISKKSGLSFRTVIRELPKLERVKFVINHRKIGKANMYKLNTNEQSVILLKKFALVASQTKELYEPVREVAPEQKLIDESEHGLTIEEKQA